VVRVVARRPSPIQISTATQMIVSVRSMARSGGDSTSLASAAALLGTQRSAAGFVALRRRRRQGHPVTSDPVEEGGENHAGDGDVARGYRVRRRTAGPRDAPGDVRKGLKRIVRLRSVRDPAFAGPRRHPVWRAPIVTPGQRPGIRRIAQSDTYFG
jgi:hypothetical protein